MKTNKEWHEKNKMPARNAAHSSAGGPKHATLKDRIKWHIAHAKNCGCREMPKGIKREILKTKSEK